MRFIKISENEWLNVNCVCSFKVQSHDRIVDELAPAHSGIQFVTGKKQVTDAALIIQTTGGKEIRLKDAFLEAALKILVE